MSKAFRMYLLHPDDDLSCSGSARVRKVAPFRIRLWYSNSVPNESVHRSPNEQHMRMILKPSSFNGWDSSSDSESGRAVEGSEEHFDESEHVIVRRSAVEETCACGWRCAVEETYTAE
jgi:hypothetical protein